MIREIVIIGAGGHAASLASVVSAAGHHVAAFTDQLNHGQEFLGRPVISENAAAQHVQRCSDVGLAVGIGDNFKRQEVANRLLKKVAIDRFPVICHPSASISQYAEINAGTVVMPQANVGPCSTVETFAIINSGASIDHDCYLGHFSSLSPGVVTGGNVRIGRRTTIGIGVIVREKVEVSDDAVVGAGSLVLSDIEANCVAYGSPCKKIRFRETGEPYLQ